MYLNLDFTQASPSIVSREIIVHNSNIIMYALILWCDTLLTYRGVFPHECIALQVVKTT